MAGFTKLWSTIVHSTVWQEALHVKVTWITMLALADSTGYVGASVPGLASAAGVTLEQCEESLEKFKAPDPYSRTKDHEGRRIVEEEGGWRILNYAKHRAARAEEERRMQNREAQRRHRAKKALSPEALGPPKAGENSTPEPDRQQDTLAGFEQPQPREPGAGPPPKKKAPAKASWVAEAQGWWTEAVGVVSYARVGAALKPLVDKHGWEKVKLALVQYVLDSQAKGKSLRIEWFAAEAQTWIAPRKAQASQAKTANVKPWEREEYDLGLAKQPQIIAEVKNYKASLNGKGAEWWTEMVAQSKRLNRHPIAFAHEWLAENKTT